MAGLRTTRSKKARMFQSQGARTSFESNIVQGLENIALQLRGDALAKIAYSGVRVMYDGLLINTPVGKTGKLRDSLYHWYDNRRSSPFQQIYMTGPNKAKAPHWYNVEYGHQLVNTVYVDDAGNVIPTRYRRTTPIQVRARPYIRPTYFGNIERAQAKMAQTARELLAEAFQ